ncbi:MAG: hypothetical protein GEU71_10125 [Actinobacteria bacterium]|nr:hypothetical protein [Actinomycetota bacterium]
MSLSGREAGRNMRRRLRGLPTIPRGKAAPRRSVAKRRWIAAGLVVLAAVAGVLALRKSDPLLPTEIRGSPAWARVYYGDPDRSDFRARKIIEIEFLGRTMLVHRKVQRHFLRLESLFEARAPDYAAAVAAGELDDWSYFNRSVRGEEYKSNHSFGIAIDVNALTNVLGTVGDMPEAIVTQWELEGGAWGGSFSRPDPMHFETHLTPKEIKQRYRPDGSPKDWYLEELSS